MAMILLMAGLAIAADVALLWICLPALHQYRGRWLAQAGGLLLAVCVVSIPPVLLGLAAHKVGATRSEFTQSVLLTMVVIYVFMFWMVFRLKRTEKAG